MLSDPLVLTHLSVPSYTGGAPLNFRRVAQGRYVCTDAPFSLDQQARLSITPTIKAAGYSTMRYRLETDKNVPAGSIAMTAPVDDTLTVDVVVKFNPRSHGHNEANAALIMSTQMLVAHMPRLQSGES